MKCRYEGCEEGHPVADEDEQITCPTCRKDLGLPRLIRDCYPEGECPDCGEDIPNDAEDGDECANCGHIFYPAVDEEEP